MIYRSKAPLRLGLAGGGTDISPYCDTFGGVVLNATIDMYAYCTIVPKTNGRVVFHAVDLGVSYEGAAASLAIDECLPLHKGVYNHILKEFDCKIPLSFVMTTYSDAPAGSGLGSSSTMVVAMLKCYVEWLNLPLGEGDIARMAYAIERRELGFSGGKQDQYAAAFGGFNYIEFWEKDRVVINPLPVKNWIKNELENSLVLYYTGQSRDSAKIIDEQQKSTAVPVSLEGMHGLKRQAECMKDCLLKGDFDGFAACLAKGWEEKKKTSASITNPEIEALYAFVMQNGAKAAKISGAGGGGFMMIVCDAVQRYSLMQALRVKPGKVFPVSFTHKGCQAWTLYPTNLAGAAPSVCGGVE